MSNAKGKTTKFFRLDGQATGDVAKLDGQDRGTVGTVFSPRGDARKFGGIVPFVGWPGSLAPFQTTGCFGLGSHAWGGATDVLFCHNGKVSVLQSDTVLDIITGHRVPSR